MFKLYHALQRDSDGIVPPKVLEASIALTSVSPPRFVHEPAPFTAPLQLQLDTLKATTLLPRRRTHTDHPTRTRDTDLLSIYSP
jgi:hypothetical protein